VACRGGRPELASRSALGLIRAPTLFVIGAEDYDLFPANERAFTSLVCEKEIAAIPGASNLFEEPGALERMARLATAWFARHLDTGGHVRRQ
jgi:putative phosphoribosyl transferase